MRSTCSCGGDAVGGGAAGCAAPGGGLYVGTSPEGKVYQVSADGSSKVLFEPGEMVRVVDGPFTGLAPQRLVGMTTALESTTTYVREYS